MDASVNSELDRLISRRASQDQRPDLDEQEESWKASVRAYTARRREEMREGVAGIPSGPGRASQGRPGVPDSHEGEAARLEATERSSVMARERFGNGYLGRAATRRRMRSRDCGYVGSEKALVPARRRMAQSNGKIWR